MRVAKHDEVTARPDTAGSEHRLSYMPALDGIRGLAVLGVLFFHGGGLVGGYLGVDAFFVLSGFLITSLLLAEHTSERRVDLAAFWTRRARRLLPALFAVLLAVVAYAAFVASTDELGRIRSDSLATLGYVANWHSIAQGNSYWDLFRTPSPLEHTWSLAIEEQFYLLWPLLFVGVTTFVARRAARRSRATNTGRSIFAFSLALVACSVAVMLLLYTPGGDTTRVYFGTDTRAAAILLGAALAGLVAWRGTIAGRRARLGLEVVAIVGIGILAAAWTSLEGQAAGLYQGGFLALGLATTAVIASASHPQPGPVAHVLSFRPLRAIGVISYGLYLWHWPIYVLLSPDRTGLEGDGLLVVRIAASLAAATASYLLIERPVRHGSLRGRRLLGTSIAAGAACALALVSVTAGATNRGNPDIEAFVSTSSSPRTSPTTSAVPSTGSRVLVVGDSVARNIGWAAEDDAAEFNVTAHGAGDPCVFTEGTAGYQAVLRDQLGAIDTFNSCESVWREQVELFQPHVVVAIFGTGASFLDASLDGEWATPCDRSYQRWYREHLTALFEEFAASGAQVFVARIPYGDATWLRDDADARIDCINAIHERVADELDSVETIDPTAELCPAGHCPESFAGNPVRRDGMHFVPFAAEVIARAMLTTLMTASAR